jgi:hypothetical protein
VLIGALFDLINDNVMAFEVPATLSGRYNPSNCRLACSASYSASQTPARLHVTIGSGCQPCRLRS